LDKQFLDILSEFGYLEPFVVDNDLATGTDCIEILICKSREILKRLVHIWVYLSGRPWH